MSTLAFAGYKGIIQNSSVAGGAKTQLGELRNWKLTVKHAEFDATSHDSSGYREIIQGIESWTGSADLFYSTGATLATLNQILLTPTKVDFAFWPAGSSNSGGYTGSGFITDFQIDDQQDKPTAIAIQFAGTGPLSTG